MTSPATSLRRSALAAATVLALGTALLTGLTGLAGPARAAPTVARATLAPAPAGPGPALTTPVADLAAALTCTPDLATSTRTPVLLVHGTGATASDDFGYNYAQLLPQAGIPTCSVDIPGRGYRDLQVNVEYVVHAVRAIAATTGRKVSVIGHSQGAFLPTYALRFWPDLARKVDDVVGYAGVYDYGTDQANVVCATPATCSTAFSQFRPGSALLRAIAATPLPAGPSYTAYTTALDEIVTPQPLAGTLTAPGAVNYRLQDICPLDVAEHLLIIGELPLYALTLDALTHPGPADLARVGSPPCGLMPAALTSGPALVGFGVGTLTASSAEANPTMTEPALRCYLVPACADVRRAPALAARTTHVRTAKGHRAPRRFAVVGTLALPTGVTRGCEGEVTIRFRRGGRTLRSATAALRTGPAVTGPDCTFAQRVRLPRSTSPGRARVTVTGPTTTQLAATTAPERRVRVRRS